MQELLRLRRLRSFDLDFLGPLFFDPGQAPLLRLPGAQGRALAALLGAPGGEVDALPAVRGKRAASMLQLFGDWQGRRV